MAWTTITTANRTVALDLNRMDSAAKSSRSIAFNSLAVFSMRISSVFSAVTASLSLLEKLGTDDSDGCVAIIELGFQVKLVEQVFVANRLEPFPQNM